MGIEALAPAEADHGRGQVGRDHLQAMAGEERAVVARAGADLQQPPAAVIEHPAEEQFALGDLPRLLLLLVPPRGAAVVGGTQAVEHVLVPGIRTFRVGRHLRTLQHSGSAGSY